MPTTLRPSRALFRFSGAEAQKLLFDVVTGRLVAEPGPPVWWALLSPLGKIQAEGLSSFADGAFWLDVDAGVADAFLKRMKMYRLRAAVEIEDLRESHAVGWDGGAPHTQVIGTKTEAAQWAAADSSYDAARIALGIARQFAEHGGRDAHEGVGARRPPGLRLGRNVDHAGTAGAVVMRELLHGKTTLANRPRMNTDGHE